MPDKHNQCRPIVLTALSDLLHIRVHIAASVIEVGSSDSSLQSSFLHKPTIKDSLTSPLWFARLRLKACHSGVGGNVHCDFQEN